MATLIIDPAAKANKPMRNILGMNNQPLVRIHSTFLKQKVWWDALNLRYVRHHDVSLAEGNGQIVDVSRIFPLFHLDENDPRNYRFQATDDYFSTVARPDLEIDFRLGECIDHSGFAWYIQPPADPEKWARICRNIVAHYKNGENNGMHLNITRVTVWEEPDNPKLFAGTVEQYAQLYCAVYKLFKQEFPDIQVGGPTMCSDSYTFFGRFLDICKENGIAPDFATVTQYYRDLDAIPNTVKTMRNMLVERGFTETSIIVSEWHLGVGDWSNVGDPANGFEKSISAAYSASTLIRLMDCEALDIAFFYAWSITCWAIYNGGVRRPVYFGLLFFNELAAACTERLEVSCEGAEVLAGKTADGKVRLLVSCYETEAKSFSCQVKGAVSCTMKAVRSDYAETTCTDGVQLLPNADGCFEFAQEKDGSDVFFLEFTMA